MAEVNLTPPKNPLSLTNTMVITGVVVAGGRWAKDKPLDISIIVPIAAIAFFLILLSSMSEKLANGFSLIILVVALMKYGPDIFEGLGLIKK